MRTLYLDIFSGISGDMLLGALLDVGVELPLLRQQLAQLGVEGFELRAERRSVAQIQGTKLDVLVHGKSDHELAHQHEHEHEHEHHDDHDHKLGHQRHPERHQHHHDHHHPHGHDHHADSAAQQRSYRDIQALITASRLSDWVKSRAIAVFGRIARAEGAVHGVAPEDVHFHEVGALDSIADIVGACIALELLGMPRVRAAAVVDGCGWVDCAHGRFPVPVPATLAILGERGVAITQCEEQHELVTPTGAALLAELAESFGPIQGLVPEKIGYGLGSRKNETRPNVLRAILGREAGSDAAAVAPHDWQEDSVVVLEANLDDVAGEVLGDFVGRALGEGALDVFCTPIQMKKSRPGVLLSVLCEAAKADALTLLMLRETSTFGVRRTVAERRKLRREIRRVQTAYGEIEVKLGWLDGAVLHRAPEYESCRAAAERCGQPLRAVYDAAIAACAAPGFLTT